MPLSDELVSGAASRCQTALIVIGRTAGEDRDNAAEKGSWYLTDGEEAMLEIVCRHFSRTVVILNVGNIIDMSFVDRYEPSSVLYIWQGGMEGGSGAVDVITGKVPASGRLSDTIAYHIDDYPSTRNFGCEDTIRYEEDIYVGYRYFETFAKFIGYTKELKITKADNKGNTRCRVCLSSQHLWFFLIPAINKCVFLLPHL